MNERTVILTKNPHNNYYMGPTEGSNDPSTIKGFANEKAARKAMLLYGHREIVKVKIQYTAEVTESYSGESAYNYSRAFKKLVEQSHEHSQWREPTYPCVRADAVQNLFYSLIESKLIDDVCMVGCIRNSFWNSEYNKKSNGFKNVKHLFEGQSKNIKTKEGIIAFLNRDSALAFRLSDINEHIFSVSMDQIKETIKNLG